VPGDPVWTLAQAAVNDLQGELAAFRQTKTYRRTESVRRTYGVARRKWSRPPADPCSAQDAVEFAKNGLGSGTCSNTWAHST
jgi:hypothetical protein